MTLTIKFIFAINAARVILILIILTDIWSPMDKSRTTVKLVEKAFSLTKKSKLTQRKSMRSGEDQRNQINHAFCAVKSFQILGA